MTTKSDERLIGSEDRPARARARLLAEEDIEQILTESDPSDPGTAEDDDGDDDEEDEDT